MEAVIQLKALRKEFDTLVAVDELTLDIHKGEILGLLGPNGAGKTTAIRMICGLTQPTAGEVLFNLNGPQNRHAIRGQLGVCPQENIFWPRLTCREQLILVGRLYGLTAINAQQRCSYLLEELGLDAKAQVLAAKLSGGMQRRLSIALALVHDPAILILDEPEAGLDPQSRILVREFIRSLADDRTVILTTHNMDEADRMSDRVAIIDQGVLEVVDTPTNLKHSLGNGDVLDVELAVPSAHEALTRLKALIGKDIDLSLEDRKLHIRAMDLVEKLPGIHAVLMELGLVPVSMSLRENTLEDVFIHLTGRQLRS
jgi:ABC-2 type transport system ATP-binding protein